MNQFLQSNILEDLKLDNLSEEKKTGLIERMAKIIQERVAIRVIKLLPAETLDEYLKIVDNNEIDGYSFLAQRIPDYQAIIDEEVIRFRQEITV